MSKKMYYIILRDEMVYAVLPNPGEATQYLSDLQKVYPESEWLMVPACGNIEGRAVWCETGLVDRAGRRSNTTMTWAFDSQINIGPGLPGPKFRNGDSFAVFFRLTGAAPMQYKDIPLRDDLRPGAVPT